MNMFILNIALAIIWAALWGSPTLLMLGAGYVLGFFTLWFASPVFGLKGSYFLRSWRVVRLILYFIYELIMSSLRVAYDVLTPDDYSNPAILEMPLDVKTDFQILLITNLISLTPGTLSLDVSPDRKTLTFHAMYADDPEALIADTKNGMERLVREVFEE
ncbi:MULTISPECIES: Na+/H+ antiporter subunit E [unclassified Yoonia]|uniref:Na+/H+ antiporter subunit E n=1 Tax=unclassified Yoonia TaxID=2629118 RepID=UPI002AFFEEBF|nr:MULTISPECIES: Na+/H+ antiporter subunit E [unclassified Yoonia]